MLKKLLNVRTIASALRTVFYVIVTVGFLLLDIEITPLWNAIIVGLVLADYVTWMTRTVALLPVDLAHGFYDGAINIIFAVIFFSSESFTKSYDAEALFTGCFIFFLVVIVKALVYSVEYARYSLGDD